MNGHREPLRPTRRRVLQWGALSVGVGALSACGGNGTSTQPTGAGATESSSAPSTPTSIANAQQAAELVAGVASQAADAGSYGIGGALIVNATGEVLQTMPNRVIERVNPASAGIAGETFTSDPTAHGERQLVYWYLANRESLGLPDAAQLTVVTSLDPCVMCTGALLTAGLNAATVSRDTFSGINFNNTGTFASLPSGPRELAAGSFGYYAVDPNRAYQGAPGLPFADTTMTREVFERCRNLYQDSAGKVRDTRKNTGTDPSDLRDPATEPTATPVIEAFRKVYPEAFNVKIADFRTPDAQVRAVLEDLVANTPGAANAVAFIDPFGNLVVAAADSPDNPAAPAFLPVAANYSTTRFGLINDPATVQIAQQTLTSPKFGTFVFLYAPNPGDTTTVETLGAYGSTVEGALPQTNPSNFQFFNPPTSGTVDELLAEIAVLPPLYSSLVEISPQQVAG